MSKKTPPHAPFNTKAFRAALAAYLTIKAQQRALTLALDDAKAVLLQCSFEVDGPIITNTHVVKRIETERRTLVKEKLLLAGVTPRQIMSATKVTPVVYVTVTQKKVEAA